MSAYDRVQSRGEKNTEEHGALTELMLGTVDGLITKPVKAVVQTINQVSPWKISEPDYAIDPNKDIWTKTGNFIGTAFDYVLISRATAGMGGAGLSGAFMHGAVNGAILGALTPVSDESNFWKEKARISGIYAGTFGTMNLAGEYFGKAAFLGQAGSRTFMQEVGLGALSGAPGGAVNAELTSLFYGRGPATLGEVTKQTFSYAAFGAVTSAANAFINRQIEYGRANNAKWAVDPYSQKLKFTNEYDQRVWVQLGKDGKPLEVSFDTPNGFKELIYSARPAQTGAEPKWDLTVMGNGYGLAGARTVYVADMPVDAKFSLDVDGRGLNMQYRATHDLNWPVSEAVEPGTAPVKVEHLRVPDGADFVKGRLPKYAH